MVLVKNGRNDFSLGSLWFPILVNGYPSRQSDAASIEWLDINYPLWNPKITAKPSKSLFDPIISVCGH